MLSLKGNKNIKVATENIENEVFVCIFQLNYFSLDETESSWHERNPFISKLLTGKSFVQEELKSVKNVYKALLYGFLLDISLYFPFSVLVVFIRLMA